MRRALAHVPAAILFAALAIVWSFPLVLHLSTHLPGPGIGDNALSLWNFWWMRTALASGADFFQTAYRFAPVGEDLTLYTHTAFPAFVGATLLKHLPLVTALNVTVLVALALNGFLAYLLAWRIVRDRGAAMVAGVIFGSSPYVSAHLNGHFDLIGVWTIPLFTIALLEAIEGSVAWALITGVVLAGTAYVAYYYVVYDVGLVLCFAACRAWEWSIVLRDGPAPRPWLSRVLAAAVGLDVAAIVAIVWTGGFDVRVGAVRVSMHDPFNPLQLFWVLIAATLWIRFGPRVRARARASWSWRRAAPPLAAMLAGFFVVAGPLVLKAIHVVSSGQYVTQQYYWRSSGGGVDLATLVLGNPFHAGWGPAVQRLYVRLGIDLIESGGWLGLAPLALAIYAVRKKWADGTVRQWTTIASVFFVWALGAHVHAAGRNIGLIIPGAVMRWIPFASNARMPGRMMVVVYLALGVLAAVATVEWRRHWRRPSLAPLMVAALVFVDFVSAPFPVAQADCPAIYQTLRDRPESGSLAELPLAFGDGLGPRTPVVDQRVVVCQTIHGRPLVGGITSRLPPNVLVAYKADPLIAAWLRLSGADAGTSGPAPSPSRALAAERIRADGIAFVMLNRATASPELREFTEQVLPLRLLSTDGERSLYLVSR